VKRKTVSSERSRWGDKADRLMNSCDFIELPTVLYDKLYSKTKKERIYGGFCLRNSL